MCTVKQQIKKRPWLSDYFSQSDLERLSVVLNPNLSISSGRVSFVSLVTFGTSVSDEYSKVLLLDVNGKKIARVGEIEHLAKPVRWYRRKPQPYTSFNEKETYQEALNRVKTKQNVRYFLDLHSKTLYIL